MVQTYGRQSVDETREILKKLHRVDLMQMFSETSSEPKVDEHQPPVFEKTVKEDVEHVLSETLSGLKLMEFEKFKWVLQLTYFQRSFTRIQWHDMKSATTPDKLVHLMVMNQQPVEVTKEVLLDMNRTDLVERLMGTDSGLQEKHQPELPHQKSTVTSLHWTLWETLRGLRYDEQELFKQHLLHIAQEKGLPGAPERQVKTADRDGIVMLMVDIYGQQSVELTKDVLYRMNKTDLLKTLSGTSSGFNTEKKLQQKDPQHQESTMTPVHSQLLETLEELGSGDLEKFKHALLHTKMKEGLPKIPKDQVETADKDEIVKLMVEIYGQRCVEVTEDILEMMNRTDLVGKLSERSSVSKGPFGCVEPDDCGQEMPDSGHWTKLDPEVNSTDGDESPTYSLQSEVGNGFECNVSGIRWICKDKVSFQYKFCSWEEHIERMESLKYLPAGPLMNIKVIAGKFDEVYLPHWICIDGNTDILGEFAVLHIDDCGDVVEQVSESRLAMSNQHFVDKYQLQLTDRVSHMDPILDRLLDRGVLQREAYDTIRALPTSQKKMRELYCGCLQAGAASKDIFYQILLENEKFLIDDLNTKH
nr:uncharacterized protein LOC110004460 [Labrus bergylta]